jgi:ABC-2 type transport system ATP-binding protein
MIGFQLRTAMAKREPMQENPGSAADKSVVVEDLSKSFGTVKALCGVSFTVGRGEVVALLGPNGAGKTTAVDILSTLTRPDGGHVSIAGFDVVSQPAQVRRSIMLTGQQVALDEMLTGRENLVLFGRLQGLRKSAARSRAEQLLREFDLVDAAERRVGTYSGGMKRRIDVACGLVVRPEVVFLDEPTTGLDPRSRQTIWDLVAGFKSLGIATLLTTQYLEEADALSDRIIVIDHGVVVAEGTANELKERTGSSYCEIVPRDLHDLPAIAGSLGSLMPERTRAALTAASDRIAIPAPEGARTLGEALSRINSAGLELADIALRRPSLDEVFLALTKDSTGAAGPDDSAEDGQPVDMAADSPNGHGSGKHRTNGDRRSWLVSHGKALTILVACVIAVPAVSLIKLENDSRPVGDLPAANTSVVPAGVPAEPRPESASSGPRAGPPPASLPTPAPLVAPEAAPVATTLQQHEFADERTASTPAQRVSVPQAPIASPAQRVSVPRAPIASPPQAVSVPQAPIASPPQAVSVPEAPIASSPMAPAPTAEPPPPPDPIQIALSPLLGALP